MCDYSLQLFNRGSRRPSVNDSRGYGRHRPTLRFAIGFCLSAALLLPLGFAYAEPTDDSLRL
jgi:hypothetical protein